MARRIDKIKHVLLTVSGGIDESHRLQFNGNAPLTLEVHAIKDLLSHFSL